MIACSAGLEVPQLVIPSWCELWLIFKISSQLSMIGSSPLEHTYSIIIVILSVNVISVTIVVIPVIDSIIVIVTVNPWIFIKEVFIDPFLTDRFTYILQHQMMEFNIDIIPCLYSSGLNAIWAIQYCLCSKINQLIKPFSPCISRCLDKGDSVIQERGREFFIDAVVGKQTILKDYVVCQI